jgi:hypothetical protein
MQSSFLRSILHFYLYQMKGFLLSLHTSPGTKFNNLLKSSWKLLIRSYWFGLLSKTRLISYRLRKMFKHFNGTVVSVTACRKGDLQFKSCRLIQIQTLSNNVIYVGIRTKLFKYFRWILGAPGREEEKRETKWDSNSTY